MGAMLAWLKKMLESRENGPAPALAPTERAREARLSPATERILASARFSADEINDAFARARRAVGEGAGEPAPWTRVSVSSKDVERARARALGMSSSEPAGTRPELSPASKRILASARFGADEINQAFAQARRETGI